MGLTGLDHVVIAVTEWERSNAFYRGVIGGGRRRACAVYPVRPGNSDANGRNQVAEMADAVVR